jgi:hypothetical protein
LTAPDTAAGLTRAGCRAFLVLLAVAAVLSAGGHMALARRDVHG